MNVCKYVHRTVQNGEHFKVNCSVFILNWLKNNCFKLLWKHFSHQLPGVRSDNQPRRGGMVKLYHFLMMERLMDYTFFAFCDWTTNYRWKPEHAHRRLIRLSGLD